jgi:hypothetical protein
MHLFCVVFLYLCLPETSGQSWDKGNEQNSHGTTLVTCGSPIILTPVECDLVNDTQPFAKNTGFSGQLQLSRHKQGIL